MANSKIGRETVPKQLCFPNVNRVPVNPHWKNASAIGFANQLRPTLRC